MSVKVLSHVWSNSSQKGGNLLVLLALADFSDDEGLSWPSIRTIAGKARMSERRVQEVIRELEADGEVETVPHFDKKYGVRMTNSYRIKLTSEGAESSPPQKSHPQQSSQGCGSSHRGGASRRTRGVRPAAPLKPSGEPSGEPSIAPSAPASPSSTTGNPDPMLDALARSCGYNPRELIGIPRDNCAHALALIVAASPGVTADEIMSRAARWPRKFGTATLTPHAMAKHWAALGGVVALPTTGKPWDAEPEDWRNRMEEHYPQSNAREDFREWPDIAEHQRKTIWQALERAEGRAA